MIVVTHVCGPTTVYFRFGVWESADAAADFSTLVLFGFESTFDAAFAAWAPVWRVLFPGMVCQLSLQRVLAEQRRRVQTAGSPTEQRAFYGAVLDAAPRLQARGFVV